MTTQMRVAQWGGQIYSDTSGGDPVEVWTNTLHYLADTSGPTVYDQVGLIGTVLAAFINDSTHYIHASVSFEFLKVSDVDVTTGHWASDPVALATSPSSSRGGATGQIYPITTACRVSIDNNTRNPRARGGFFLPRPTMGILDNGRWNGSHITAMQGFCVGLMTSLNAVSGIDSVGVYSKTAHQYFPSSRLRVGNVPDNISRRKNNLREAFISSSI